MDYFDNGSFIENINDIPNPKPSRATLTWLIAGLVFVVGVAGVFMYKYEKSKKELDKIKLSSS